jgi:hypothetical protein
MKTMNTAVLRAKCGSRMRIIGKVASVPRILFSLVPGALVVTLRQNPYDLVAVAEGQHPEEAALLATATLEVLATTLGILPPIPLLTK